MGTGPFKFVSRTAQESVVLERFDDYWGEKPELTKVTYKIIENADSILLSLQSGAVDVFAHLTTTQIAAAGRRLPRGGGHHEPSAGPVPQQRREAL